MPRAAKSSTARRSCTDRPAAACRRTPRNPPHRRILGTGQGQCDGRSRTGPRPPLRAVAHGVVSGGGTLGTASDFMGRVVGDDRIALRHRGRERDAQKASRTFRGAAQRLCLPAGVLLKVPAFIPDLHFTHSTGSLRTQSARRVCRIPYPGRLPELTAARCALLQEVRTRTAAVAKQAEKRRPPAPTHRTANGVRNI